MRGLKIFGLMLGIALALYGFARLSIETSREVVSLMETLVTSILISGGAFIAMMLIFKDFFKKKEEAE